MRNLVDFIYRNIVYWTIGMIAMISLFLLALLLWDERFIDVSFDMRRLMGEDRKKEL